MFSAPRGIFGGSAQPEDDEVFLNLTPMIDILTCLLFFLLLSFGAVIIALINASVPVQASESEPSSGSRRVTLGISISHDELVVSATSGDLDERTLGELKRTFPRRGAGYDFAAVHEHAWKIKSRFPGSATVVITPAAKVPYETLVRVMDATRERLGGTPRRPIKVPMFPEAVVATLVR